MFQKYIITSLLFTCLVFGACKKNSSEQSNNVSTTTTANKGSHTTKLVEPNCPASGKVLKHNKYWLKEANQLLYICADKSTYDKKLGDSHRMLEVYDANCQSVFRKALPINVSPDFPYQIADINYGQSSQLLAIKGHQQVYCYDIENKKILPALQPTFDNGEAKDAQSGRILHLELWEQYLVGFAQDHGVFVFDMKNHQQPKAIKSITEYKTGEHPRSLFLLSSANQSFQAISPTYNSSSNLFKINPLLDTPLTIDSKLTAFSKDKRWVIFNTTKGNEKVLVDLKDVNSKVVPSKIQALPSEKVFEWARGK